MKIPSNKKYVLFGGTFVLANKLQVVADKIIQGLSTKQWFLLRNLSDFPADQPPTITTLAKATDTSRQNVRKMLAVLQREGYITIHNDINDQRSQHVILTDSGKTALELSAQEASPFFSALFSGITDQECSAAANVLIKMVHNLEKLQEDME